jgi:asparagine synthase (glutamine-hydrolysing)
MRLARRSVTVALSGDGGDEFFGGYNRYLLAPLAWRRLGWIPSVIRHGVGRAFTTFPASTLNRWLGGLAHQRGIAQPGDKLHKLGRRLRKVGNVDDLYRSLLCEWDPSEGIVLGLSSPPVDRIDDPAHWPALQHIVDRMMLMDGVTYLPDDILAKVDRASMAVSLETRAPMLDHRVVEFAWSLPQSKKIRGGEGKWLLRQLLYRHVPRELVNRPKMGFGIPLDAWLRGPLKPWASDLLDEGRLRRDGYFDPAPIRAAWNAHQQGQASNGYRLWSVLMFQSWMDAQTE